jgi:hypothetical protein
MLGGVKHPDTFACRINGFWLDSEMNILPKKSLEAAVKKGAGAVCKGCT